MYRSAPGKQTTCADGFFPAFLGNTGAAWNYGSNFGGQGATPYSTDHSIFGSWGVADTAYSTDGDGSNDKIGLCAGTAGSVCSG